MDADTFFAEYVADRRRETMEGMRCEPLPHFTRHTALDAGSEGMVCYTDLPSDSAEAEILAQIAYFRALGQDFEWKCYELDRPANLRQLLERHGFVADEPEALMCYPLQSAGRPNPPRADGCQIVRVDGESGLRDVLAVQAQVWGRNFDWLHDRLLHQIRHTPERISMFCAYLDGQPVGSGWTSYPDGSRFPELHGGAVLAAHRGSGVYSRLFDVRFEEAKARGYGHMTVDAAPMSRPILERIGFQHVCMTWPMRIKFGG